MRLLLLLVTLLAARPSAQEIVSVAPAAPTRGEAVTITFSAPVDSVAVTYRPGAVTAVTETFVSGGAVFTFTPSRAGVVAVTAGATTRNLSVHYVGVPLSGLAVLILAGLILFGGAALSLRVLLSTGPNTSSPRSAH